MCGILGIVAGQGSHVNQLLYDGLLVLQHRGQDAAGIVTCDGEKLHRRKAGGLVSDVFYKRHMKKLVGHMGIGHVRYPTAGTSSVAEAQPFYVNSPYGITLAHNGNLTNATELRTKIADIGRHLNTSSDSEMLLNIFAGRDAAGGELNVYHFDLYRLALCDELEDIGAVEFFHDPQGVSLVEWAERMPEMLPPARWEVQLEYGAGAADRTIRWRRPATGKTHGRKTE